MHDRFSSADSLADITDDDLRLLQVPSAPLPVQEPDPWWEAFQYDLYDWNDPGFIAKNKGDLAYVPVLLTQGYFMMVHPSRFEEMTKYPDGRPMRWSVHIGYNKQGEIVSVYARRNGRTGYDNVENILAHRQLLDIVEKPWLVGEHFNGRGLDNRCCKRKTINLGAISQGENLSNTERSRMDDLPKGVVRVGKAGNYRYYGQACVRSGKKVITYRSRKWKTPEPAGRWYQNYLKRKYKRGMWASQPETVNMPFFPRKKSEARKARQKAHIDALLATF